MKNLSGALNLVLCQAYKLGLTSTRGDFRSGGRLNGCVFMVHCRKTSAIFGGKKKNCRLIIQALFAFYRRILASFQVAALMYAGYFSYRLDFLPDIGYGFYQLLDGFHSLIQGGRILAWYGRGTSRPSLNPELIFRITRW